MGDRAQPWDVASEIAGAFYHAASIEDGSGRDRDAARSATLRQLADLIDPRRNR